jgi:hypothetical protein
MTAWQKDLEKARESFFAAGGTERSGESEERNAIWYWRAAANLWRERSFPTALQAQLLKRAIDHARRIHSGVPFLTSELKEILGVLEGMS